MDLLIWEDMLTLGFRKKTIKKLSELICLVLVLLFVIHGCKKQGSQEQSQQQADYRATKPLPDSVDCRRPFRSSGLGIICCDYLDGGKQHFFVHPAADGRQHAAGCRSVAIMVSGY